MKGASTVEFLAAFPVLLVLALFCVQIGLIWHAKFGLSHAAIVAARAGSVQHGSDRAIRDGLIRGMLPLVGKSTDWSTLPSSLFLSGRELTEGISMGWLNWEVISPTRQSFLDWGRPIDPILSPGAIVGDLEIPFDGQTGLSRRLVPRSGVVRWSDGLAVGASSEQSLLEANTLKLVLRAGVPLNLPVVGKLLAGSLAWWSGCGAVQMNAKPDRAGLVSFGSGANASVFSSRIECRALSARSLDGRWAPRWPVTVSAVIQMQSNARQSVMVLRDRQQSPNLAQR